MSSGKFVAADTGRSKLALQWNCVQCSFCNKPTSKKCEMCESDRPQKLPLTLLVTVPSHPKYAHDPLLLSDQKHTLSLGFLKDVLEAKCAVPFAKQLLFYQRERLIEGGPNERLVDLLPPECNVAEVIVLTLHHADKFEADTSSASSKAPASAPLLRKKSSRSRTGARPSPSPSPPGGAPVPSASMTNAAAADDGMDGFDDDAAAAFAADDDDGDAAGGWGDDDDAAAWDNSDEAGDDEEMKHAHSAASAAPAAAAAAASSAAAAASASAFTPAAAAAAATPSAASRGGGGFLSSLGLDALAGDSSSGTYESHFARTAHYILRKPSQMNAHIRALLEDMSEVLGLSADQVAILCRNFKERWNRARIEDAWMEDSDKLREQVGLGPEQSDPMESDAAAANKQQLVECQTCGDEVAPAQSFSLSCGHVFCLGCWEAWIGAEFDKGPVCITTRCQGFKCSVVVPTEFQLRCLPPLSGKREKLTAWILEDFVSAHSKNYKGCPHSDCLMTAQRVEGVEHVGGIDCACAHSWCFDCGQDDHRPASCEDAKKWNDKNNSEAENTNWILANTKVCPKCQVHIEKNQGCNHMTCRKCNHQFCWLCKADWNNHSSCASYTANGVKSKEEADAATAQNELKKYMFYWSRFDNHAKSIKFAEKTRKAAEEKMAQLQALKGTNLLDVQFLVDASNCVINNKRILQWLYVYAYYFPAPEGSSDRALFEMQQAQLEKFTDELHGMTEQSMEELMKAESRVRILSFTSTVAKFRRGVMEAVELSDQQRREREAANPNKAKAAAAAAAAAASARAAEQQPAKKSKKKASYF